MVQGSLAAVFLALGVLIGHAAGTVAVTAQSATGNWQAFRTGETVRLAVVDFAGGPTITCKVFAVEHDFLGCEGEGDGRKPRWVNLRFVQEITPAAQR